MLTKLSYAIEMAFDIPDSEKKIAIEAVEEFEKVINTLNLAENHLDLMYEPFKKSTDLSPKLLTKKRGVLNRFKQQVKENYNIVKKHSLLAIEKLNNFSSDSHILEMINSFKDSVQDVEDQVVNLMNTLDDFQSSEFKEKILGFIENIKKQSAQVNNLIKDRIIKHIDTNILVKNWTSSAGDELKKKIEDTLPLVSKLYHERQQALEQKENVSAVQTSIRPQIMNLTHTQRVQSPNDLRTPMTEE